MQDELFTYYRNININFIRKQYHQTYLVFTIAELIDIFLPIIYK